MSVVYSYNNRKARNDQVVDQHVSSELSRLSKVVAVVMLTWEVMCREPRLNADKRAKGPRKQMARLPTISRF